MAIGAYLVDNSRNETHRTMLAGWNGPVDRRARSAYKTSVRLFREFALLFSDVFERRKGQHQLAERPQPHQLPLHRFQFLSVMKDRWNLKQGWM